MANLKYYREEQAKYPWHYSYKVNNDEGLQICFRAFWHFGLPPLKIDFDRRDGCGFFRWNWLKRLAKDTNRISLSQISSIGVILHEIAHYMDYLNRVREMDAIDSTGQCGFGAEMIGASACRRIRKEHFHGNRHRAEMAKLVRWFEEDYKKHFMSVDMAKAA